MNEGEDIIAGMIFGFLLVVLVTAWASIYKFLEYLAGV